MPFTLSIIFRRDRNTEGSDRIRFESYLFTIAAHKIRDHLRKQGRHPLGLLGDHDHSATSSTTGASSEPAAKLRGASSLLASAERMENEEERLAGAIAAMLDEWRAAGDYRRVKCVELLMVCGWANKDVAKLLALTEQQVANWKFQALERLQRRAV